MSDIELTTKQRNKIKRALKSLESVRDEVAKENPDNTISWYISSGGNVHLMDGETHGDYKSNHEALYDNVIDDFCISHEDHGDW
jgi:hypothetical protein